MPTDMSLGVTSEPQLTASLFPSASLAQPEAPALQSGQQTSWLVVEPGPPGPAVRGRLALFIEGAIERALDAVGAPPPGIAASCNMTAALTDQLCRARCTSAEGFTIHLATLSGIADINGCLDSEDSAAVRWWVQASTEHPVRMRFASVDAALRVFDAPRTLESLIAAAGTGTLADAPAPLVAPEVAASIAAMELSELPPTVAQLSPELPEAKPSAEATPKRSELGQKARALAEEIEGADSEWLRETLICLSTPPPPAVSQNDDTAPPRFDPSAFDAEFATPGTIETGTETSDAELATAGTIETGPATSDEGSALESRETWSTPPQPVGSSGGTPIQFTAFEALDLTPPSLEALAQPPPEEPPSTTEPESIDASPPNASDQTVGDLEVEESDSERPTDHAELAGDDGRDELAERHAVVEGATEHREEAPTAGEEAPEVEGAVRTAELAAEWSERCEMWRHELQSAHGPKPLAVVERQFVSAFVKLRDAIDRGFGSAADRAALEEWSRSFEKSYAEAFNALRVRGKRPTMVLDIPDIALRMARLHGARSTQLLLVDGMRFDLGMRVHERLKELNHGVAACAERLLLWSALPTTSAVQVELIGRGPAGLRDYTGEIAEDLLVAKGRKANTIRRLRTGQRELLKLDLAEARLSEAGGPATERLDAVGQEIAERLASHFEGVPERTLVMIFGDHGFQLDAHGSGTTAATQGGASPEEVLVPAFAWVVGAVH